MQPHHLCCPTDRTGVPGVMPEQLGGSTVSITCENDAPFNCYVSGESKHWVVVIYDIFGMHPNKYELADWFAKHKGLSVAVPDVRRGHNWPMDMYPPPPDKREAFYKYLENEANPKLRGVEVLRCIDYLRETREVESVSILGLCWGAKVASLIDSYDGIVKCVVGAHPSFLKSEDGEKTTIPTLMMPCAEDNMTAYLAGVIRNKNPKLITVSENYFGTFHGFLGARGQWKLPVEKPFVDKAKDEISAFVLSHIPSCKNMRVGCCTKLAAAIPPASPCAKCPN